MEYLSEEDFSRLPCWEYLRQQKYMRDFWKSIHHGEHYNVVLRERQIYNKIKGDMIPWPGWPRKWVQGPGRRLTSHPRSLTGRPGQRCLYLCHKYHYNSLCENAANRIKHTSLVLVVYLLFNWEKAARRPISEASACIVKGWVGSECLRMKTDVRSPNNFWAFGHHYIESLVFL